MGNRIRAAFEKAATRVAGLAGACRACARPAGRLAAVAAAIILLAGAGMARAQDRPASRREANSAGAKPLPLVNTDDELASYLKTARQCIEANDALQAIEILQRMVDLTDTKLLGDSEGRRFVSMGMKAGELLGSLGPEGRKLYRSLYDAQAQRLYEESLAAGDAAGLRKTAYRYLHTAYGAKALDALGALALDSGRFAQAARSWKQALAIPSSEMSEPLLLAKLGTAQHLAGEANRFEETLAALRAKHPQAVAVLGGRERNVVEFLEEVRRLPVPASQGAARAVEGWAGLGAQADGMAVMGDVDVVLAPRWTDPQQSPGGQVRLVAMGESYRSNPNYNIRYALSLKEGHLEAQTLGNQGYDPYTGTPLPRKQPVPPAIQPVIAGDVAIYRTDGNLVALDLVTGELRWAAVNLPMERASRTSREVAYYGMPRGQIEDTGRYTLTLAEGMVFTLASFRPQQLPYYVNDPRARTDPNSRADTSELVALSVARQGSRVWSVGNGEGRDEVVRNARYLCAPTYEAGRLYVMAVYLENYYVICLEAATGDLVWHSMICQVPATGNEMYGVPTTNYKAFPPAVSDGRVFVATNAGVVAALDADTGQAVWAYQYDSPLNQVAGTLGRPRSAGRAQAYPPNPVLATGGKVIVLPADSEKLMAFSTDDGWLLWETDRGGMNDLSAADGGRAVLSGPGLQVVSLADGSRLWGQLSGESILGRPAVTPKAVYASGRGRLVRLDLADYTVSYKPLASTEDYQGLLGNLVSAGEQLLAANAAGICSYMNYEQAWARLTKRIEAAEPKARCELLLTRGRFAYNAKHLPEALTDLLAAGEQAAALNLTDVGARLRPWLHRTYVGLGHVAEDPNVALAMYEKAMSLADSAQEKGHMRLRLAKFHRARGTALAAEAARLQQAGDAAGAARAEQQKNDELVLAVRTALELAQEQGEEELADVQIGKDADDSALLDGRTDLVLGKRLAREVVQGILKTFGRRPYAEFDAQAKVALDAARQTDDEVALAQIARRWPDSLWADPATTLAAESLYRKALRDRGESQEGRLNQAVQLLAPVAAESSDATARIVANVGLAAIYAIGRQPGMAGYCAQRARELAAETAGTEGGQMEVAFADLHGKLEEVLKEIGEATVARTARPVRYPSDLRLPLVAAMTFRDEGWVVLRDHEEQPVRLGDRVLMLRGNRAAFVSTMSNDANDAVDWQALTSVDGEMLRRQGAVPTCTKVVAGLSRDEKVVVICDRSAARGFDVGTARALWSRSLADLGMPGGAMVMAVGGGYLVAIDSEGRIGCADAATGKVLWQGVQLLGPQARYPSSPPQIVGGRLLVRHDNGRRITCLDLADSGRVVGRWDVSGNQLDGRMAPNGNLVLLNGGRLEVRDAGQLDKVLWSRGYTANDLPRLLAVSDDMVVVSRGMQSSVVEVLAMTGGDRPLLSQSLPDVGGGRSLPVDAVLDGKNLLVAASPTVYGGVANSLQVRYVQGLSLHRIDLEKGRRTWSYDTEAWGAGMQMLYSDPVVGANYVALLVRSTQGGDAAVHIVDMQTGKRAGKIDLMGKAQSFEPSQQRRLQTIGPPVMTNGRLAVETLEGVVVYGQ